MNDFFEHFWFFDYVSVLSIQDFLLIIILIQLNNKTTQFSFLDKRQIRTLHQRKDMGSN